LDGTTLFCKISIPHPTKNTNKHFYGARQIDKEVHLGKQNSENIQKTPNKQKGLESADWRRP
jgi:hypothetical protein